MEYPGNKYSVGDRVRRRGQPGSPGSVVAIEPGGIVRVRWDAFGSVGPISESKIEPSVEDDRGSWRALDNDRAVRPPE